MLSSPLSVMFERYFKKLLDFNTLLHTKPELMEIEIHKNQQRANLTKFVRGISINSQRRKGCNKKIFTASEIDHFIHNFAVT